MKIIQYLVKQKNLNGAGLRIGSFLICLTLSLLSFPAPSHSAEIAVFMARSHLEVHDEVLRGFRSVCHAQAREFEFSGNNIPELKKEVAAFGPKLIFAIGSDALAASFDMNKTPVVFSLVLKEDRISHSPVPVTGVNLLISPEQQLEIIHQALPAAKKIGVIYNPAEMGHAYQETKKEALSMGLKIIGRKAKTAADAINEIRSLQDRIDALWLLPDVSVMDYETVKYAILFSFRTKIPVIAPSDRFVKNGALLGLGVNAFDIGVQAGEIANEILSGRSVRDIPIAFARDVVISVNLRTARQFGITIPGNILKKSKIYGEE